MRHGALLVTAWVPVIRKIAAVPVAVHQHAARHSMTPSAFSAAPRANAAHLRRLVPAARAHQQRRAMSMSDVTPKEGTVSITIIDPVTAKDGRTIQARIGASILDVAQQHDMELEGACEGTLACSTCHCVFTQDLFDQLPPPDEEELDMLDLAAGLTDTSRLGCQVKITADFEGHVISIPDEFNDLQ